MNYEFPNRIIINKTMEDEKLEDKSKEEYVTKYTSSDNEVAKFNSEIQTNYSSLEEIKKIHSESLSVISDSSEGGNLSEGQDCNKSSDHICKLRERKRTYNMGRNIYDAEFPKISKRSKSHIFKKSFKIEDVVNEEQNEEDNEKFTLTKRKNYFDFLPVKDRFQFQTLHTDKGIRLDLAPAMSLDFGRYSCTSSNVISSLMDPVYEVKEESNQPEINGALLQSPRINCFTDNMEDSLTNNISPKTSYYSTFPYHLSKNYSMDSEAIAEDNNENIVEKEVQIKKKDSRHKFETFVDKEENVMFSNPFSEKDADFETINEEVLEEEILIHQKLNNLVLCADEVEENNVLAQIHTSRMSLKIPETEVINELEEENDNN